METNRRLILIPVFSITKLCINIVPKKQINYGPGYTKRTDPLIYVKNDVFCNCKRVRKLFLRI